MEFILKVLDIGDCDVIVPDKRVTRIRGSNSKTNTLKSRMDLDWDGSNAIKCFRGGGVSEESLKRP